MNILVIDPGALALDFCLRSEAEGHKVRWFIRNKPEGQSTIGDGLVEKVRHWEYHMKWADLIFLPDNAVYMRDLEQWRNKGYPIYGANETSASWELDRQTGVDVFEAAGIPTIPGVECKTYAEAIEFVKRTMGRYVCKPFGDADRSLTYVSKGPADMVYMLQKWQRQRVKTQGFIMQVFKPGIEMAVGAWMGREGFDSPWCENFEHKKLMPDDKGPNTGEMGTVVYYTDKSKLADLVLAPLEGYLRMVGHMGFVDVAVIIDGKGNPWPLEFTMRPGWPIFNIQQQLHRSTAKWMLDAIEGRSIRNNFVTGKAATGVVVAIPDFPYNKRSREEMSGVPIYNVEKVAEHIHPCELKLGTAPAEKNGKIVEAKQLVSAGTYLLVAASAAPSLKQSIDGAYKAVNALEIPNSPIYRSDIGKRVGEKLKDLQRLGYATDLKA